MNTKKGLIQLPALLLLVVAFGAISFYVATKNKALKPREVTTVVVKDILKVMPNTQRIIFARPAGTAYAGYPTYPHYSKDNEYVYFHVPVFKDSYEAGIIVSGADPKSFRVIADEYGVDDHYAYYDEQRIPDSHGPTFKLKGGFASDKNNVYFGTFKLPLAEGASFELLNSYYARDNQHGFILDTTENGVTKFNPKPIEGSDGATFSILPKGDKYALHAIDSKHVYFKENVIPEADPTSFTIKDGITKDDNHVFCGEQILAGADPATYQAVKTPTGKTNTQYKKDRHAVYFQCQFVVTGADPVTFFADDKDIYGTTTSAMTGKDAKNSYSGKSVYEPR